MSRIPFFCAPTTQIASSFLFRGSDLLSAQTQRLIIVFKDARGNDLNDFKAILDFYGTEIVVGKLYSTLAERIGLSIHDIHLFFQDKSLSVDMRTWQGKELPLELATVDQLVREHKTTRWRFSSLVQSEVGLVDKFSFLLYDRLCQISPPFAEFVYSGTETEITVQYITRSDTMHLAESVRLTLYEALFSQDVASAFVDSQRGWERNRVGGETGKIVETQSIETMYINNLRVESVKFKLFPGYENASYDLASLFARFRLSDTFPIIQFVENDQRNVQKDLRESKVRLLKSFVTGDRVDILDSWFSLAKREAADFYDSRGGVIVIRTAPQNDATKSRTVFLVYSDGSAYAMYNFSSKGMSFDDFAETLQVRSGSLERDLRDLFLQQFFEWNPLACSVPARMEMYGVGVRLKILVGKRLGTEFDMLVKKLRDFVEPLDEGGNPRDLHQVRRAIVYKKVSNYDRDIDDALHLHIQRSRLSLAEEDRGLLREALYSFLVEIKNVPFAAAQEAVENFVQRQTLGARGYKPIDEGIYIYFLGRDTDASVESIEYECVVRAKQATGPVLFHCLYFINNLVSEYQRLIGQKHLVASESPNDAEEVGQSALRVVAPMVGVNGFETDESQRNNDNRNEDALPTGSDLNDFLRRLDEQRDEAPLKGRGKDKRGLESTAQSSRKKPTTSSWKPLTNLQQFDPELYKGTSQRNSRGYSSSCQTTQGRVPILYKNEAEFITMIQKLKRYFPDTSPEEMFRGDRRFYVKDSQKCKEEEGYALRNGNEFYICPEAYCTFDKIPLLLRQLENLSILDDRGKVSTLENFFAAKGVQRQFKVTGNCPVCNKGVIREQQREGEAVYINPYLLGRQGYPGFLEGEDREKRRVCCFKLLMGAEKGEKLDRSNFEGVPVAVAVGEAQRVRKASAGPPKNLVIVSDTSFCKPASYGLLPVALSKWFNAGLEQYAAVVGSLGDIQNYQQFVRKGVGWSSGMLTNLMDVVYELLIGLPATGDGDDREALSEDPKLPAEKISRIIKYMQSVSDFSLRFYQAGGGTVARAFSVAGADEGPEEAFFNYLTHSRAWDESIILPILSALPIFRYPVCFAVFEAQEPPLFLTRERHPNVTFTVKTFAEQRNCPMVYIFMQKTRVSSLSDTRIGENFVRGGFVFEKIVLLEQSSTKTRKPQRSERELFYLSVAQGSLNNYGEIASMNLANMLTGLQKLDDMHANDRLQMYVRFEDIENIVREQGPKRNEKITLHYSAQILDIRYRCTHILVNLCRGSTVFDSVWLPVFPRDPVVLDSPQDNEGFPSKPRLLQKYSFWKAADRIKIEQSLLPAARTMVVLDQIARVFGAKWPYSLRRLIVRDVGVSEMTSTEGSLILTGLQLNEVAFTYVRREKIEARDLKHVELASIVDNFMFDFYVVTEKQVVDQAHLLYESLLQKDYDWRLLQYYYVSHKRTVGRVEDERKDFVSFVSSIPWAEDRFPLRLNPIYVEGKPVYCLSVYNKQLVSRLYREQSDNRFVSALYQDDGIMWRIPDAANYLKDKDKSLFFYFYEWKSKIVDFLLKKLK